MSNVSISPPEPPPTRLRSLSNPLPPGAASTPSTALPAVSAATPPGLSIVPSPASSPNKGKGRAFPPPKAPPINMFIGTPQMPVGREATRKVRIQQSLYGNYSAGANVPQQSSSKSAAALSKSTTARILILLCPYTVRWPLLRSAMFLTVSLLAGHRQRDSREVSCSGL